MNSRNNDQPPPAIETAVPSDFVQGYFGLFELWTLLWRHRLLILLFTLLGAIAAGGLGYVMKPKYRASVLFSVQDESSTNGAAGVLGGDIGMLASLAGISTGGGGGRDQAIALLGSRQFTEEFILSNSLMPILFPGKSILPVLVERTDKNDEESVTIRNGFRLFNLDIRKIQVNSDTGLVKLVIEWGDRVVAQEWANSLVELADSKLRATAIADSQRSQAYLQDYLQKTSNADLRRVIYDLIGQEVRKEMLATLKDHYTFRIIDPAVVADTDEYFSPKRAVMIVLGSVAGFFFALFIAFFRVLLWRFDLARNHR